MDWNRIPVAFRAFSFGLPLYEGVDWNWTVPLDTPKVFCLPLYEGVDWNHICRLAFKSSKQVSLFTREWIEIYVRCVASDILHSLPLYEGVDWNPCCLIIKPSRYGLPLYEGVDWNGARCTNIIANICPSPSLRGSGLKYLWHLATLVLQLSPSLRGSGLKFLLQPMHDNGISSPSLRGSGLKLYPITAITNSLSVSLFTREWIEIDIRRLSHMASIASPSLRGSGLKSVPVLPASLNILPSPSLRGSGLKSLDPSFR